MHLYAMNAQQVLEKLLRERKYIEDLLKQYYHPNARLAGIERNAYSGERINIYDLHLTNGSPVILKLNDRNTIDNEIAGLEFAARSGIDAPRLYFYEKKSANPLHIGFLLMEHLGQVSLDALFIRNSISNENSINENLSISKTSANEYLNLILRLMTRLHRPVGPADSICHSESIIEFFAMYRKLIEKSAREENKPFLTESLDRLWVFYQKNRRIFNSAPLYPVHGDLDPWNMAWVGNRIILIDWEHYHTGDCCEDIAYFIERTYILSDGWNQHLDRVINVYETGDDKTIRRRVHLFIPLMKIWHILRKGLPVDSLKTYIEKNANVYA